MMIPRGADARKKGWKDVVRIWTPVIFICCSVELLSPSLLLLLILLLLLLLHLQFVVLSYTNKKLLIYDREEDMGTGASPQVSVWGCVLRDEARSAGYK